MELSATSPPARASAVPFLGGWIRSPLWDGFWVLNALDRAVFRLSNPEVRRAARGLFD